MTTQGSRYAAVRIRMSKRASTCLRKCRRRVGRRFNNPHHQISQKGGPGRLCGAAAKAKRRAHPMIGTPQGRPGARKTGSVKQAGADGGSSALLLPICSILHYLRPGINANRGIFTIFRPLRGQTAANRGKSAPGVSPALTENAPCPYNCMKNRGNASTGGFCRANTKREPAARAAGRIRSL